jgi:hypothetical protein
MHHGYYPTKDFKGFIYFVFYIFYVKHTINMYTFLNFLLPTFIQTILKFYVYFFLNYNHKIIA